MLLAMVGCVEVTGCVGTACLACGQLDVLVRCVYSTEESQLLLGDVLSKGQAWMLVEASMHSWLLTSNICFKRHPHVV